MAPHQLRVLVTSDVITVGVKCNAEFNNASQNSACVLNYIVFMISFIVAFNYKIITLGVECSAKCNNVSCNEFRIFP